MRSYLKFGCMMLVGFVFLLCAERNSVNVLVVLGSAFTGAGLALITVAVRSCDGSRGIRLHKGETIYVAMKDVDDGVAVVANPGGLSAHSIPMSW